MKLSQKLRELREEKGLTQQELADQIGCGVQSIRNYENDSKERVPSTIQLKMLKDFYNVTYEYLLDDECNNKTVESASIGKELKLSDEALDKIINLQYINRHLPRELIKGLVPDYETPIVFNDWIENSDIKEYLVLIKEYQNLNKILEVLQYFNALKYFENNISDLNDTALLKKILSILENKLEEFKIAVNNSYLTNLKEHGYEDINKELDRLRNYIKNFKKNIFNERELEEVLIFIQSIGEDFQEETSRTINYCLFEITEVLKNEMREFYSVEDNLSIPSEYKKILGGKKNERSRNNT